MHLQFHGNSSCVEDVFLSNGVASAPQILSSLAANIAAASTAAAPSGPVLTPRVFDATGGCFARGTDNMQMRFASGLPHTSICAPPNLPVGPSRFIHIEQRRDARRAVDDPAATPGRNRAVVIAGILAPNVFVSTWSEPQKFGRDFVLRSTAEAQRYTCRTMANLCHEEYDGHWKEAGRCCIPGHAERRGGR